MYTHSKRGFDNGRSGFTLIELMIIIAIIGLLAAILFPVLAYSRDKAGQTQCLSNLKQLAMASHQYSLDWDGLFPLTTINTGPGQGWVSEAPTVPERGMPWMPPGPNSLPGERCYWSNCLQPYFANGTPILACPVSRRAAVLAPSLRPSIFVSYTMNGLLSSYPTAGVANAGSLPLFWEGLGKAGEGGRAYSLPALDCPQQKKGCVYVAPSGSCSERTAQDGSGRTALSHLGNGESSYLPPMSGRAVHDGGVNIACADGSVRWRKLGGPNAANTDYHTDPWATYDASGRGRWAWYDRFGCHPYLFRPDYDANHAEPAILRSPRDDAGSGGE